MMQVATTVRVIGVRGLAAHGSAWETVIMRDVELKTIVV